MSQNLFNKLADEVILEILNHLDDDFDANCNRDPRIALNPNLLAIAQANRRLRRIAYPPLYRRIAISTILQLEGIVQMLATASLDGGLVRSVWLGWGSHTPTGTQRTDEDEEMMATDESETTAMDDTAGISTEDNKYPLLDTLIPNMKGQPWAKSILLLFWLYKLEVLELTFSEPRLDSTIAQMIHRRVILPNLKVVKRSANQGTIEADLLVPAFLHPSVTEIRGSQVVSSEIALQCGWLLPQGATLSSWYGKSSVERIELYSSRLDSDALEELLRLPRALKTFVYSEAGTEYELMKMHFEEALDVTRGALENLSVRWKETGGFLENDYTWDLSYFTSLRCLFVSYRLMFGPQPDVANFISDVFPPSLQVLGMFPSKRDEDEEYIEDEWKEKDYVQCFESLLLEKDSSNLPNLRLIAHFDDLPLLECIKDLALSRDVQVALHEADLESLPI